MRAKQYRPSYLPEEFHLEEGQVLLAEGSEASHQLVGLVPWKQIPNQ
jgi:hypothetical protein